MGTINGRGGRTIYIPMKNDNSLRIGTESDGSHHKNL